MLFTKSKANLDFAVDGDLLAFQSIKIPILATKIKNDNDTNNLVLVKH